MELYRQVDVKKYVGNHLQICRDKVVKEFPITIFINDEELATLVCTPAHLEELALGFLYSEGILTDFDSLKEVTVNHEEGFIWVETRSPVAGSENFLKRHITTCCGKGRPTFYFINDTKSIQPLQSSHFRIPLENIKELTKKLEDKSHLFRSTGGVHGAALCDQDKIIVFYEDIGRHNAVDKIVGHCFLHKIPLADKLVAVTGRISSEILIKVGKAGVPMIVSRSAPTDLALQMAEEIGISVVGFVRGERVNVYTYPDRVTGPELSNRD